MIWQASAEPWPLQAVGFCCPRVHCCLGCCCSAGAILLQPCCAVALGILLHPAPHLPQHCGHAGFLQGCCLRSSQAPLLQVISAVRHAVCEAGLAWAEGESSHCGSGCRCPCFLPLCPCCQAHSRPQGQAPPHHHLLILSEPPHPLQLAHEISKFYQMTCV